MSEPAGERRDPDSIVVGSGAGGGPTVEEPTEPPRVFEVVHAEELVAIDTRRAKIYENAMARYQRTPDDFSFLPPREPPPGPAEDQREKAQRVGALDRHLAGLALSGGGIRSATFAIGVLQALADLKLLTRFDYLSTVSGGGYAGGWLAAWLRREGDVFIVQDQLAPSRVRQREPDRVAIGPRRIVDEEPEPISHLRSYSNYLAPWKGLLTADTWTLLAIYVRNTLINFLLLVPLALVAVLGAWVVVKGFDLPLPRLATIGRLRDATAGEWVELWAVPLAFVFLLFVAFACIGQSVSRLTRARAAAGRSERKAPSERSLNWLIVAPLVLSAVLSCWIFSLNPVRGPGGERVGSLTDRPLQIRLLPADSTRSLPWGLQWVGLLQPMEASALEYWVLFGILHLVAHLVGCVPVAWGWFWHGGPPRPVVGGRHSRGTLMESLIFVGAAFASGASGGFLFFAMISEILWGMYDQPWAIATVGPPLAILVFFAAASIEIWLLGRWQSEDIREWWARLCALLLIAALVWAAFFGIVFYVPPLVRYANSALVQSGLVAGWVTMSIGGALAGRSPSTTGRGNGNLPLELLGRAAPVVFLVGLLAAVSMLVGGLVNSGSVDGAAHPAARAATTLSAEVHGFGETVCAAHGGRIAIGAIVSVIGVLLASYVSDANLFSLHGLYANRLTRCYLGASRPKRSWWRRAYPGTHGIPKQESQFSEELQRLANKPRSWVAGQGGAPTTIGGHPRPENVHPYTPREPDQAQLRQENPVTGFDPDDDMPLRDLAIRPEGGYWGPYPIFNTALNLVAGKELAWKDRKAESFVLSPLFSGSKSTWYRRMTDKTDPYLTLGRAMAISGAAADPNMGVHQSAPLTALMTVFNARLGWWLENPRFNDWMGQGPGIAWPLVWELLGRTDETHPYVHLSDGGHFENLGVYELVRRRCRYIVTSDAGQDPAAAFEDLAKLIRLCRIDFGIRIDIDVDAVRPVPGTREGRWHCAVGRIRYDDVDGGEVPGVLIYLKTSLTGDEPTDLRNYAAMNPQFPHQTTANQFFDEAQFESYRALGYHIGQTVFREAVAEVGDELWTEPDAEQEFIRGNRKLFAAVQRRWATTPPDTSVFTEASKGWLSVQDELRRDAALGELSIDIYPELAPHPAPDPDGARAAPGLGTSARLELHTVARMLEVMEAAWVQLTLDDGDQAPMNRGWMSVFRRWASTDAFRRHWPTLRSEYSEGFVRFCEGQLRLGAVAAAADARTLDPKLLAGMLDLLELEFVREWPGDSLKARVDAARASWNQTKTAPPWLWVVLQTPVGGSPGASAPQQYACGLVVVRLDADCFEFLPWLRRPYRAMGIGGRSVRKVFADFCQGIRVSELRPITIRARYPAFSMAPAHPAAAPGALVPPPRNLFPDHYRRDDDASFNLWRNFFSSLDFRANPRDKVFRADEDVILERTF